MLAFDVSNLKRKRRVNCKTCPERKPLRVSAALNLRLLLQRHRCHTTPGLICAGAMTGMLALVHANEEIKEPEKAPEPIHDGSGPSCPNCGNIAIRAGSCYCCPTCGSTTGCS